MVHVTSGSHTHVGRVRAHNEDALLDGSRIWAVADGMGGHAAGEVASAIIIETLRALDAAAGLRPGDLVAALDEANVRILDHGERHPEAWGLGSTVTGIASVRGDDADVWAVFNLGDSRVYREHDGRLVRATVDHSEAEELLLAGVITPEQSRTHRGRNIVTRSLGQPEMPQVDLWLLPQRAGERFVVCSDGLNSELADEEIHRILTSMPDPQQAAAALVWAALASGGHDNVTVIVLDVDADGAAEPA